MIRQDLACPTCDYNLRGLHGDIVTCPECGTVCDVATLVTARWTEAWWKAPGFNYAIGPAAIVMIGFVMVWIAWTLSAFTSLWFWIVPLACVLAFAAWLITMYKAWIFFADVQGLWLALLAHLIMVAMFVSAVSMLIMVMLLIFTVLNANFSLIYALIYCLVLVAMAVVLWIARKGEKFIAQKCIRRHLQERSKVAQTHVTERQLRSPTP